MEQKFQMASSSRLVPARSLDVGRRYPVLGGERADTRYGPTIILRLSESNNSIIKICLPKRYVDVLTDADLAILNSGTEIYDLVSEVISQNSQVLKMVKHST
jgi:hypothetical protein